MSIEIIEDAVSDLTVGNPLAEALKEEAEKRIARSPVEALFEDLHTGYPISSDYPDKVYSVGPAEYDQIVGEMLHRIAAWHHDRNLIDGSDDKSQFCKLVQEVGELSDNICKGKDIRDDVGDIVVVLINLLARRGISFAECLLQAYADIAPRKGRMVDGVFVKEADEM